MCSFPGPWQALDAVFPAPTCMRPLPQQSVPSPSLQPRAMVYGLCTVLYTLYWLQPPVQSYALYFRLYFVLATGSSLQPRVLHSYRYDSAFVIRSDSLFTKPYVASAYPSDYVCATVVCGFKLYKPTIRIILIDFRHVQVGFRLVNGVAGKTKSLARYYWPTHTKYSK